MFLKAGKLAGKKISTKLTQNQKCFKFDLVTNVKFLLSEKNLTPKLDEKATLIFEDTSKNIYYDSENLSLTKKV